MDTVQKRASFRDTRDVEKVQLDVVESIDIARKCGLEVFSEDDWLTHVGEYFDAWLEAIDQHQEMVGYADQVFEMRSKGIDVGDCVGRLVSQCAYLSCPAVLPALLPAYALGIPTVIPPGPDCVFREVAKHIDRCKRFSTACIIVRQDLETEVIRLRNPVSPEKKG